ncbi:ATP-binding protein, partial [Streptomyces sp. NPDC059637]
APAPAPAPAPAAGTAPPAGHPERPSTTAGGLPKRRRRAAAPAAASPAQPAQPAPDAVPARRPAENTASVMGAWQRGTRSGRSGTASADEGNQA